MARLGLFDDTLNNKQWFDDTALVEGWFDQDLVPIPSSGVTGDVTESLTATDSQDATLATSASLTESVTATDSQSNTLQANGVVTESASATDQSSNTLAATASLVEALTATETVNNTLGTSADITEALSASVSTDATIESPGTGSITESANPQDFPDAFITYGVADIPPFTEPLGSKSFKRHIEDEEEEEVIFATIQAFLQCH